jgi:cob(I)alamin adenosyltransferase
VAELESAIDQVVSQLPPLRAFVLPGGTVKSALLHQARTLCRRAERSVVTLREDQDVPQLVLVYLNRLSDLLFVLARLANHHANATDTEW